MVDELEWFLSRVRRVEGKAMEYIREGFSKLLEDMRCECELESVSSMLNPSWSSEGYLRPLYMIRDVGDAYVVYLDLPKADLGTVDVRFRDNSMSVRARLREEVSIGRWSSRGEEIRFYEYRDAITLPFRVDPSRVRVEVRGDRVKVVIGKD